MNLSLEGANWYQTGTLGPVFYKYERPIEIQVRKNKKKVNFRREERKPLKILINTW